MKLSVHGVAAGVADYIRSHSHALMVSPWAWRPNCPPETSHDIFEALRIDENGVMRTDWAFDNGLRAYWNRYRGC